MSDLETVDLPGLEILEADIPIFGVGSPPEGDIFSVDELQQMASAHAELASAGEHDPPASIGHSPKSSDPRVGSVENVRVEGSKLVADVKHVPRKFADLLKARAYPGRSVELKSVTSQTQRNDDGTPKVYDKVVSRLSFLGAKVPAVRTLNPLDAALALYESGEVDEPEAGTRILVMYQAGDVVWDPEAGFQDLMAGIQETLNPGPGDPTYWVSDVAVDRTRAIAQDYSGGKAWIVPLTVGADGEATVGPSSDWLEAEQAWVEASAAFEEGRAGKIPGAADTRPAMADSKYTDEQRRAFTEATGLEADKVTDEVLAAAGVAVTPPEPATPAADTATKAFEERVGKMEKDLEAANRRAFEAERNVVIETALREGRFEPGEREGWERSYEANPESVANAIARMPKNDTLAREFGSADDTVIDTARALEEAHAGHLAALVGVKPEELI